jgi:dsDNA-specific endonuclease/ATPase MutS2
LEVGETEGFEIAFKAGISPEIITNAKAQGKSIGMMKSPESKYYSNKSGSVAKILSYND